MSAFICSNLHISTIVNWAARNRVTAYYGNPTRTWSVRENEVATCNMLMEENVKSVNYRYRENEPAIPVEYVPPAYPPSAVQVIKLAQCLRYQSCEHPGWIGSAAEKLLGATIQQAISKLPGYEEAHWSIW